MRVFFNAIIVQIFLSAYIYWFGWQGLPDKKYLKILYVSVYIVELIIYFIGFFTSEYLSFEALHDLAWVGTTWMLFTIYMTGLLLIYDLMKYLNRKGKILPKLDLKAKKNRLAYFVYLFMLKRYDRRFCSEIPINVFGKGLLIWHPERIIINPESKVGDYCALSSGVVIAQAHGECPTIGNHVELMIDSKVLG